MSSTASASINHMPALSLSLAWIHLASSPPCTPSPLDTEDGDGSDCDRQEARTCSSVYTSSLITCLSAGSGKRMDEFEITGLTAYSHATGCHSFYCLLVLVRFKSLLLNLAQPSAVPSFNA
ncbi:hypothetical protein B0H11DRAFT_2214813 [Mycena galericulata]|nr:hypothetical protein B0H11DRAFT_2214813 [Mycena galericulata]